MRPTVRTLNCLRHLGDRYRPLLRGVRQILIRTGDVTRMAERVRLHPLEQRFKGLELVDVQHQVPGIRVDLVYGSKNNFIGKDLYQGLQRAYLHRDAAAQLREAQEALRRERPDLTLLVHDAVRPNGVQREVWRSIEDPALRDQYLTHPDQGSIHSYAMAVDVSLFDLVNERPCDLGTAVPYLGRKAWPSLEDEFLESPTDPLTPAQVAYRQILRRAMAAGGFSGIADEWWHFNAKLPDVVRRHYDRIE